MPLKSRTQKPKAIWIIDSKRPQWNSVKPLAEQYLKTYRSRYNVRIAEYEILKTKGFASDITLIFGSNQIPFQQQVELIERATSRNKILSHLYGDVLTILRSCSQFDLSLRNRKFNFVVGAEHSFDIAKKLLKGPPVFREFSVQNKLLKKRQTLNQETSFYYSGRISYYKNVHLLVRWFAEYWLEHRQSSLHIYGGFDSKVSVTEFDLDFLNYAGELFYRELLQAKEKGVPVHYHGYLEKPDLLKRVSTHDVFCTLSTAPEEDFSLAAEEAIQLGQGVICTNWGGLKRLKNRNGVGMVRVKVNGSNILIRPEEIFKNIGNLKSRNLRGKAGQQKKQKRLAVRKFLGFAKLADQRKLKKDFFENESRLVRHYWI